MASNPFLDLADRQIAAPVQARRRAAETRTARRLAAETKVELDLFDDHERQLRRWRHWRQERLQQALAGPHGEALAKLLAQLRAPMSDAAMIEAARAWREADAGMRFLVLHLIDTVLIRRRERVGLPAFDDPLPGAPLNAFLVIRALLEDPDVAKPRRSTSKKRKRG